MDFTPIDLENWPRREHYEHYSALGCTYSMTTRLDITALRRRGRKLYPTMLYHLAAAVNRHEEFRTALGPDGVPGVFSEMHPCYTVFHEDSETFSNLWTEYTPDYEAFCRACRQDMEQFGANKTMNAKPGAPENTFPVSMIPWTTFEGFNLNLRHGYDYLLPIFTMGRFFEQDGRVLLPLAVQVNHAVCDGFHVCRFINELQSALDG